MLVRVALGLWCASVAFGVAHAQPRGLDELTDAHAVAARATALVLRPNPRLTAVENSGTGWVTSLASGQVARSFVVGGDDPHHPSGRYVVRHEGKGRLVFRGGVRGEPVESVMLPARVIVRRSCGARVSP